AEEERGDLPRVTDGVEDARQRLGTDLGERVVGLDAALAAREVGEHQRHRGGADREQGGEPPDLADVPQRLGDLDDPRPRELDDLAEDPGSVLGTSGAGDAQLAGSRGAGHLPGHRLTLLEWNRASTVGV